MSTVELEATRHGILVKVDGKYLNGVSHVYDRRKINRYSGERLENGLLMKSVSIIQSSLPDGTIDLYITD